MNQIKTSKCDSCDATLPGVEFHHNGTPVLQQCRICEPRHFEDQARRDIDAWLAGGDINLGREMGQ